MAMSGADPPRPSVPPGQPTQPLGAPLRPRMPVAPAPLVEPLPPELPPDDQPGVSPLAAVVAGIAGLLAGALIGFAVGDKSRTVTETHRAGQPTAIRTVTQKQPTIEVRTTTVTAAATTPPPVSAESDKRSRETERSLRNIEEENQELKRQLEERQTP